MEPMVTVAIPVFNAEKTIALAIKSVLTQSYKNWELLIINDGSEDNSINIIKQFKDARILIIDDLLNKGLINRLNSIPAMARGKYIARMDADDMMHPDRLAIQIQYMESNPNIDIADCAIYTIDETNHVKGIRNTEDLPKTKAALLKQCLFTHPAVIGKREWFLKYSYDYNYYRAEDYELWIRAYDESVYGRVKIPLFFYREGNVNIRNYVNSMKSVRKIIKNHGIFLMSPSDKSIAILKTYIKQYVYMIGGFLKIQRLLVDNRSNKLHIRDSDSLSYTISNIINYNI